MFSNGVLISIIFAVTHSEIKATASISLAVEDRVSLVGEHCPGTVRLFCEGVDLEYLRWTYNATMPVDDPVIQSTVPSDADRSPFVEPDEPDVALKNPAFLTVEIVLVSVKSNKTINGISVANFSTILTVDLAQLAQQNITNITCGQFGHFTDSLAVNVTIFRPSFIAPVTLKITNVIASYQSGSLNSVEVQWTKMELNCNAYNTYAVYQLSVNGSKSVWLNHTSCDKECVATITVSEFLTTDHQLITVKAYSSLNANATERSIVIENNSQRYFKPVLNFTNCYISFSCKPSRYLTENTLSNCSLQYATNSTIMNYIAGKPTTPFFHLVKSTQFYHFNFYVAVSEQLLVKETIIKELKQNIILVTLEATIMIVIFSLFIILSLVHIVVVILIKVLKVVPDVKEKLHFVGIVILLPMDIVCIILFILFGIILNEECSQTPLAAQYDTVVYVILVIACLGLILLLFVWTLWGYVVFQQKKTRKYKSTTKEVQKDDKEGTKQVGRLKSGSIFEKNIYDDNFLCHEYEELHVNESSNNGTYMKLNKTVLSDSASGGKYTQLRAFKKSRPGESTLSESSCSHLNTQQSAVPKESCLDETDDVNTVYEIITCTEIKEMLNPDYDDVMVFTNKQVDVTYDDIIQCTKERVNPDFEDMTLAKKEMNVEYDIIIASDSEDSSECRQDQQHSNGSKLFPKMDDPAYCCVEMQD